MTPRDHRATIDRLERKRGDLSSRAVSGLEQLGWYRVLDPEVRSWIGVVISTGIGAFVAWLRDPASAPASPETAFAAAPRAAVRRVSLAQTVDLVRRTVTVVEEAVDEVATRGSRDWLRDEVLRYSREIAFAAAGVYARAAEERGAWDARHESMLVDGVLAGEPARVVTARAEALGWRGESPVVVVAAQAPDLDSETTVEHVQREGRRTGLFVVAGVREDRLIVLLAGAAEPAALLQSALPALGEGPVVIGPSVPDIGGACDSAAEAMAALDAVPAWPTAPRPVTAAALLPERALAGDPHARRRLAQLCMPIVEAGGDLLATLGAYLEESRSLEECARVLFVHPNTVRYRLNRITAVTGLNPSDNRDAFALRLALSLHRLGVGSTPDPL